MEIMGTIGRLKRGDSFTSRWSLANDYLNHRKTAEALDIFYDLANEGFCEAYVEIGNILERGDKSTAPQDWASARWWYMKAVEESEDSYGYVGLARLALNGFAEAGGIEDAIQYLNKAVSANNPIAQTILGTIFHAGKIIEQDFIRAAHLYQSASDQGYVLPLIYLSKIRSQEGHFLVAIYLRLKAFGRAYNLARRNVSDPRLWNSISNKWLRIISEAAR